MKFLTILLLLMACTVSAEPSAPKGSKLLYALWVNGGGSVNSGYLVQPYIAAYFETKEQCVEVRSFIVENLTPKTSKGYVFQQIRAICIQAHYVLVKP